MIPPKNAGESQQDYEQRILVEAKPSLDLWTPAVMRQERPSNILGTTGGNNDLSVSFPSVSQDPQPAGTVDNGTSSTVNLTVIIDGVDHVYQFPAKLIS